MKILLWAPNACGKQINTSVTWTLHQSRDLMHTKVYKVLQSAGRSMKVTNKRKIANTEMRMLRRILGASRRDHMRNEEILRILHYNLHPSMRLCIVAAFVGLDMSKEEMRMSPAVVDHTGWCSWQYQVPDDEGPPPKDMTPTDEGRHDGCGCYPGYGPQTRRSGEGQGRPVGDREKAIQKVPSWDVRRLCGAMTNSATP